MRLIAWGIGLTLGLAVTACNSERSIGSPPGQGEVSATSGAAKGAVTSGAGGSSATGGDGGQPPLPDPADCACLAAVADETCRQCIDDAAVGGCVEERDACEEVGVGYCDLVFDCLALCPEPDAYCVDTCLGAHDSARAKVEALVACSCNDCASACAAGSCD